MQLHALLPLLAVASAQLKALTVGKVPQSSQPYHIPYLQGPVLSQGTVAYRFPITSNSSGGLLTLLTTNTNTATSLSVPAHKHIARYENFFCTRGQVQLWFGKNGSENVASGDSAQQGRVMQSGDFGASTPYTSHAFQTGSEDTEMYGVVFPGGLEDLFYSSFPKEITFGTPTPYAPTQKSPMEPEPLLHPLHKRQAGFDKFDIYPDNTFAARRDFVNGTAPAASAAAWRASSVALPTDTTTPYFVARDTGPKWLYAGAAGETTKYQLVQRLSTTVQSGKHNFTLSWLTISQGNAPAAGSGLGSFAVATAFKVEQGVLGIRVDGFEDAMVMQGDVVFLPPNTKFTYWGLGAVTRCLLVSSGPAGLDEKLVKGGRTWGATVWPSA